MKDLKIIIMVGSSKKKEFTLAEYLKEEKDNNPDGDEESALGTLIEDVKWEMIEQSGI